MYLKLTKVGPKPILVGGKSCYSRLQFMLNLAQALMCSACLGFMVYREDKKEESQLLKVSIFSSTTKYFHFLIARTISNTAYFFTSDTQKFERLAT